MANCIASLPALLLLAACTESPGEGEGAAPGDDQPADIAATADDAGTADIPPPDPPLPEGRYGASAADCDDGNTYMTEYVDVDARGLTYRGERYRFLARDSDDTSVFRRPDGVGERVRLDSDRLVRWPDQPAKRTVYTRCR